MSFCYADKTTEFVTDVSDLLEKHYNTLDSSLRHTLVKALILLRNRDQVIQLMTRGAVNLLVHNKGEDLIFLLSAGVSLDSAAVVLQAIQMPGQKSTTAAVQAYYCRYLR